MAESNGKKGNQSQNAFADDLDSMLNVDEDAEHQVGLIDDDDAIDRLLVGDVFQEDTDDSKIDDLSDLDKLIAEPQPATATEEIDEFGDDIDDIIASMQINPKQDENIAGDQLAELDITGLEDEEIDLSRLESVETIAEPEPAPPEIPEILPAAEPSRMETETMTEIDEFGDADATSLGASADFLLADFDISADESAPAIAATPKIDAAPPAPTMAEAPVTEAIDEFSIDDDTEALLSEPEPLQADEIVPDAPAPLPEIAAEVAPAATVAAVPTIDYSVEIAGLAAKLNEKINELSKQNKQARHEIQLKANSEELAACLETLDSLQTEQKKTKRGLDALNSKKPIGVYAANAVAAVAIVAAMGLGVTAMITKSQVGELIEIVGKQQQQLNAAPASDAADKEMLRKQLDELTVAQSVANNQITELSKALHGDGNAADKPSGDIGKQLNDLSNQDMQMGAAIESLQTKVAALEKGKTVAAAPAKPAPKKPVVVEENWGVNLVAFKQDWYAKRKADEFAAKGVPAKVSKSDSKGETWYRLSVDGFKSQYEAAAYAAKVKKTLNLDSVWVAKSKD